MKRLKKELALCCVLTMLVVMTGCTQAAEPAADPMGMAYFNYFDTVSYVYNYAGDSAETFEARSAEVSDILSEYHRLFDIYHEYSGINNLCTINRLAGGDPLDVDEKLIDFLLYAEELYQRTGGEMNILMGAVLRIWHDYRTAAGEDPSTAAVPPMEDLLEAAQHIDFSLLEIDAQAGTVRLSDPEASIDVGALGKGYAAEQAAEHLRKQGISGYVLNVGGNLRMIGSKPDGSGWVTGVKDPARPGEAFAAKVTLEDTSCVTSGNYERFYAVNGTRYHHIIDQDTLFPAEYCDSITVVTQDSGLADALSTALFCMSYEDGIELLASFEDVEALWIFADGTLRYTDGFGQLLTN